MTPKQLQAMKLALDFIEKVNKDGWILADFEPQMYSTIAAIKEALVQPERHELQAKGEHPAPCARYCEANAFQIVIKNLKAQLAQPEQEPVATVTSETSAERTLKSLGYTDNGGEYWKPPLGAWPPQPKQEPVAMREALKKLARFLDVVRVYAQEIRPIHELETDKPLHWKAREIQDEVIRLINTIPQQEPIHWIAPNFEFLFSSTPQRTEQEPVIDKSAAIRIATALGWGPKREWVGLTDEEIRLIDPDGYAEGFPQQIQQALKQKNGYTKENT